VNEVTTLTTVRAGFGLAQLAGPWPTAEPSAGRRIAQVLGVRHLLQAGLSGPAPTAPVLVLGVEVDLLHALTMVAFGMARRSARRPALGQAAVAFGFAVAGAAAARHAAREPVMAGNNRLFLLRKADELAQSLAPRLVPERLIKALAE
jgi:hypothetical protein